MVQLLPIRQHSHEATLTTYMIVVQVIWCYVGDSEGLIFDEYLKQEQDDCLDVLKWIAKQAWSNKAVRQQTTAQQQQLASHETTRDHGDMI